MICRHAKRAWQRLGRFGPSRLIIRSASSSRPEPSGTMGVATYDGPIVDPHMHFWSDMSHPWLPTVTDETCIAGMCFKPVAETYAQGEYFRSDAAEALGITKTVHIEATAQHPAMLQDPVAEATWVQALHDNHSRGGDGIVAFAWLPDPGLCNKQLEALVKIPNVRGVRFNLDYHPTNELLRQATRGDWMTDGDWRRGLAAVGRHGLSFDLQVHIAQLGLAAQLAQEFRGDVRFVLNHSGFPIVTNDRELADWKLGIEALAGVPNVFCKMSMAMSDLSHEHIVSFKGQTPSAIAASITPFVEHMIECFGAQRVMFASNFPVDKLWCSLSDYVAAYKLTLAHRPAEEQKRIFHDNAIACYSL